MNKSLFLGIALCAALGICVAACDKQNGGGKADGDKSAVLVTVNNATITTDTFKEEAQAISPYALEMMSDADTRDKFLDNLISKELMVQQAKKEGLDKDPEITRQLNEIRDRLVLQKYAEKQIFEKATVTDQDAKDYFDKNKDNLGSVRMSQIQVGSKEEAEEVLIKYKSGESFMSLAKTYSQDPNTSGKGGDLGFVEWQQLGSPDLREAAFNTTLGEVSNVVRSSFAFHVIKVTDKKPAKDADFDKIKEMLKEYLVDKRREELFTSTVEKLKSASKITRNEQAIKELSSLTDAASPAPAAADAPAAE